MSVLVLIGIGSVSAGAGLWLHDWRSIAGGAVCFFAAWLLHDVDSCIARSHLREPDLSATRETAASD